MTLKLREYQDVQDFDVEVADLADASRKFRAWIESNGLGAGDLARHAGEVWENGQVVAFVSFNGRVWGPNGYRKGDQPLMEAQ